MGDAPVHIGRYAVVRSLGSGGMGEVFLAYSPAGSPVAVKVIRSDRLDANTRARFEREALVARTVIGTNRVARFLDADPYADRPWLAMEYVPGRTLLQYVDANGVLPVPLVASLGALVAEGLEAVHAAGLLHRDLKPQNIILGADGPMIIDFGLAAFVDASQDSLSQSGMIVGTVRCMPPEQAGGNPHVSAAADVYALGTVMLYAAAGHYPYDGSRWEAIVAQVTNPQMRPDLSGTPADLAALLESMLAHEPEVRPTLARVADACAALLAGVAITPADARLALIARTAGADTTRFGGQPLSPSIEARLEALPTDDAEALVSPLDAPAVAREVESVAGPELEPAEAGEAVASPGHTVPPGPVSTPPRPRQRPGRPPASSRVAQELRAQYAVRSTL
jgi:eukaryotic-like serine/threonine-protein kinase